jgi:hypothetical protein
MLTFHERLRSNSGSSREGIAILGASKITHPLRRIRGEIPLVDTSVRPVYIESPSASDFDSIRIFA